MNLKDRMQQCKSDLIQEVDAFVDSYGHKYLKADSEKSQDEQVEKLREKMIHRLLYEDFDLGRGLNVVNEQLPKLIGDEDWEIVLGEFRNIPSKLQRYFEQSERNEMPRISEVFGLSKESFRHLKKLLLHLFENEDYENAYELSLTMVALFPDNITGWIATGRCLSWQGHNKRAIEVFDNIQKMFPKDPVSLIFSGWSYMMIGEPYRSKEQFEKAEAILEGDPALKKVWDPIIYEMKHMF